MSRSLSIFDPASPQAAAIRNLSFLVLAITGFIFLVVEGVLTYVVIRFRHRTGAVTSEPAQLYGSQPIEIAWTAAPAIIVFILSLVTLRTLWEVNAPAPTPRSGDGTLFVTVIGHQWWWEYRYENYDGRKLGFITANELHIPVSSEDRARPVFLTLESADVCHSFWIPRLAGKTDLIPGRINHMVLCTTLMLLSSSLTIHFAERRLRSGDQAAFRRLWMATIALGAAFLLATAYEWRELITRHHLTTSRNLFGTTYYTLVGFRGLHVTAGVVVMLIMLGLAVGRQVCAQNRVGIEMVSWYWHFIDGVWLVVFTVVYRAGR